MVNTEMKRKLLAELRSALSKPSRDSKVRRLPRGRSEITLPQRAFLLEKLIGATDKDAALMAGYSASMAKNTKGKIWSRPGVREEFEFLDRALKARYSGAEDASDPAANTIR